MASSTMTRTGTSTATKVMVGAAVAGAAAYGFMMLGDTDMNSSDPVYDPSTIQYCRNKCIVTYGNACLDREGTRCLEFSDGRCVLREQSESCDAQGSACWDSCNLQFGEVPGYYPPGYVPPGYVPPMVMEEVSVGYLVPGYSPAGYVPPGSGVPLELMPGYVPPGMETPREDLPPGYTWPGGVRLESDGPTSTEAERAEPKKEEYYEAPAAQQPPSQEVEIKKEEYPYQEPYQDPYQEPAPEKQSFFEKLFN